MEHSESSFGAINLAASGLIARTIVRSQLPMVAARQPQGTAPLNDKETTMPRIHANWGTNTGAGRFWRSMIRLGVLAAAGLALLTITLIGLFIALPLMLVGGIALYFYVRRRLRQFQAGQRPRDGVIDGEYTIIDHRQE